MNNSQSELNKGNILIVDDQLDSLRLLTNILSEQGYEVSSAISGVMALKTLPAIAPDLILLDVNLPHMNGYTICEKLKSDPNTWDIPIIFISALDNTFDKVKAFRVGGSDYITKPFEVEEVLVRIENQLHNIRLKKQLQISEAKERERAEQLALALEKIQNAQFKFHIEKMSSLGRMVAGIAHEINNPVSFIIGNIPYANQYIEELFSLLELYQKLLPQTTREIQQEIEDIDLDFMRSDLQKLLNSMKVGSDRIGELVRSLRQFARLDEAQIKTVDIHQGIDTTLIILQHRLKAQGNRPRIQIIKNYDELPKVECFPGLINQVFMNVLTNGIDALEEEMETEQTSNFIPRISISTKQLNSQFVTISITDNGTGISESVQNLIFDPFFTTKDIGKGTGLGLSISHQIIVNQHGGKIYFTSKEGKGAEFVIQLPIQHQTSSH
ncbi:MAG TPA: hybrid sensor histidine kinase/response regulator [Cyanobacteria bacterium UBA11149]|nr:hybrid sensor histidine kinase/response regulator [Cyanobacteria bacterium UBA11367]HBE57188.1 hybrid sensor histidine kinase/response regulator [Cyanobacteria bacterium UBA11366]HBK64018.1 hybrid sensor histidine kinase/response regulator [Cyanobacteria bacterium UBA11166]HBR74154.1 hybrid sensor histidine kinase/response regulator [Cyanobacteria bacterium UBA11159]HBS71482.1 hybrid sensor histidine kinase/response regulator [Cyanobacteria bacterium UBA11153]HBW90923.1 hybrid sensor histid